MNIYLVKMPNGAIDYDCYDAFVVVSESEDKVLSYLDDFEGMIKSKVVVSLIGTALDSFEEGNIVCVSFNAG